MVVVPRYPDPDGAVAGEASRIGRERVLDALHDVGHERVAVYDLENRASTPVYVHSKVCIIDDVWMAVGSDNLNRRSWTHDSELSCGVVDERLDPRLPADPGGLGDGARVLAARHASPARGGAPRPIPRRRRRPGGSGPVVRGAPGRRCPARRLAPAGRDRRTAAGASSRAPLRAGGGNASLGPRPRPRGAARPRRTAARPPAAEGVLNCVSRPAAPARPTPAAGLRRPRCRADPGPGPRRRSRRSRRGRSRASGR